MPQIHSETPKRRTRRPPADEAPHLLDETAEDAARTGFYYSIDEEPEPRPSSDQDQPRRQPGSPA